MRHVLTLSLVLILLGASDVSGQDPPARKPYKQPSQEELAASYLESLEHELATLPPGRRGKVLTDFWRFYALGPEPSRSLDKAFEYNRKAAEDGYAPAMSWRGNLYRDGQEDGVRVGKDLEQAAQWYRRAAEAGSAVGMYLFGVSHMKGRGVPKNTEAAFEWFVRAAQVDLPNEYTLRYSLGIQGFEKKVAVLKRFRGFFASDTTKAKVTFGRYLSTRDMGQSPLWFHKAAEAGDIEALEKAQDFDRVLMRLDVKIKELTESGSIKRPTCLIALPSPAPSAKILTDSFRSLRAACDAAERGGNQVLIVPSGYGKKEDADSARGGLARLEFAERASSSKAVDFLEHFEGPNGHPPIRYTPVGILVHEGQVVLVGQLVFWDWTQVLEALETPAKVR